VSTAPRPARRSLTDPRHLMRYLKAEANLTPEEIAKQERVSVATVRSSISMVDSYRKQNDGIEMKLAIQKVVIETAPKLQETLHGLLSATELVEMPNGKTGRKHVVKREDKTTRLEASRLVKDLIIGLQPKGAPVEVNVNQTNQVANLSQAETNEERMRRLRKKADEFNALPPEVAAVPDRIDSGDEDDDDDGDEEDEE
jgi:hypothetical protein